MLCSEHPLLSQIEKLIPDSQVICPSGKPHAFSRVARAFFFGGHGECCSRREQQRSPLEQLETIKLITRITLRVNINVQVRMRPG